MKMNKALEIINRVVEEQEGFMVCFEWIERGMLRSDHFPDKHAKEKLIPTEDGKPERLEMKVPAPLAKTVVFISGFLIETSFAMCAPSENPTIPIFWLST